MADVHERAQAKDVMLAYATLPFTDQVIKDVAADSRCYIMAVYERLKTSCCTTVTSFNPPQQTYGDATAMLIPPPRRSFLTLDIETLGLMHQKPLPRITCVCLFDCVTRYSYMLYGVPQETYESNTKALLSLLDNAERLAGYNAVRFDLPFIALELGVEGQRLEAWKAKCTDPYIGLGSLLKRTCKLQLLLDVNNLGSKSGTGGNAITLAKEGRNDELLEYCMTDVLLTHDLCMMDIIKFDDQRGIKLTNDYKWVVHRYPCTHPTTDAVLAHGDVYTPGMLGIDNLVTFLE